MPILPSGSFHTLFHIPASLLPWMLLSLFLPPLAVLTSTLFTSTNPKTACAPEPLLPRGPHPSPAPAETPVPASVSTLGVCSALPKLCDLQPISPLIYLLLQNFSLLFSLLAGAHPLQHSGARPACSVAGSRLMSDLLCSLLNKSFALSGVKPVAAPSTPLTSPVVFPLPFYCRGSCFCRGKKTKYDVNVPSSLSAFPACSFPFHASGTSSLVHPLASDPVLSLPPRHTILLPQFLICL